MTKTSEACEALYNFQDMEKADYGKVLILHLSTVRNCEPLPRDSTLPLKGVMNPVPKA